MTRDDTTTFTHEIQQQARTQYLAVVAGLLDAEL